MAVMIEASRLGDLTGRIPWLHYTPSMPTDHDGLAADLADYLRYNAKPHMTWQNATFGGWNDPCRPDVLAIRASLSERPLPLVYEVKVSRADFLADVRAGKWKKYLRWAPAVFFATPDKLISPKEVPEGCGLIVRRQDHWRRVQDVNRWKCRQWEAPNAEYWLALLLRRRDNLRWETSDELFEARQQAAKQGYEDGIQNARVAAQNEQMEAVGRALLTNPSQKSDKPENANV